MEGQASIVIRTKNEEKYLSKVLSALEEQTYQNYETVIVDSGSTDRTLEIADKFHTSVVEIKPEDFSYGRALNLGCENSDGEYFVFLSAHIIPTNNTYLENLVDKISGSEEIAAVFGRQLPWKTSRVYEATEFEINFPEKEISPSPIICHNANVILRKSVWNKFKYDEALPGLEDMHWGLRVKDAGFKILYNPEAAVYHIHEESIKQVYIRAYREAEAVDSFLKEYNYSLKDAFKEVSIKAKPDMKNYLSNNPLNESLASVILSRIAFTAGRFFGSNKKEVENDCKKIKEKKGV